MPIVIEEFIVDTPPPETAATDAARGDAGASQAVTAWTASFAHRLEAELALATERATRLHAD
jgi:hypothetical protein